MPYQFRFKNIALSLYHSLNEDPFYKTLEKTVSDDPLECKESMLKYYDYSMQETQKYGELVIPNSKSYGASLWTKPKDANLTKQLSMKKRMFIQEHLGKNSLQIYNKIIDFMSQKSKNIIPKNSWYLSIVGVDPEFQGKGLGKTLILPILEKTDKTGIPTFLETYTPRNISFYKRMDYQEKASFVEPITNAEYWIMIREPV